MHLKWGLKQNIIDLWD